MKVQLKTILASILFVLVSTVCVAQDPCPDSDCPEDDPTCCLLNPPPPPGEMPIDGLTTVFVLIGAVYGIRKTIEISRKHQL